MKHMISKYILALAVVTLFVSNLSADEKKNSLPRDEVLLDQLIKEVEIKEKKQALKNGENSFSENEVRVIIEQRNISIRKLMDEFKRIEEKRAIIDSQKTEDEKLQSRMSPTKEKELQADIIFALGELRAEEAIPLLIKHVDFEVSTLWGRIPKHIAPSVIALSKIGIPAVASILDELKITVDKSRRAKLCDALITIGGTEFAEFYIKKEIAKTTLKEHLENLQTAHAIILEKERESKKLLSKEKNSDSGKK